MKIRRGDFRDGFHVRLRLGIFGHRLEICAAAPLGVIGYVRAVPTFVNAGRDEPGNFFHGLFRGLNAIPAP